MKKLITPLNIFLFILVCGFILRIIHPLYYFQYQHDQDLIGWVIRDVLFNKHVRLIGQETSSQGVFIGPLFYYLLIPFYLLTSMNPGGGLILVTLLGLFSIFSFYFVLSKVFNRKVGIVASLIYAFSYAIIFADREVVPTMPVMLWSVWYFYGLWLISKGKGKAYLLLGFLLGLVWNLNLALALLTPLIPLAQILSKKKFNLKYILLGTVIFVVTFSPFIVFEFRHNFQQTKAIVSSLTTTKDYAGGSAPGLAKLDRVMQLVHVNTTRIFWGAHYYPFLAKLTFYLLVGLLVFLVYKKVLSKELSMIMLLWLVLYIAFFALNSLNVSEYYLNGMNVIWITIMSLSLVYLIEHKKLFKYGVFVILLFLTANLYSFISHRTPRNGYVERKALVAFVKEDAKSHGYPCVSISYITPFGYQFGYRYLFWIADLEVNRPISGSPVYSIVFPQSSVDRFDKSFGALGLVLPDYQSYTREGIEKSCEGPDANLTDPMFGYTQ